MRMIKKNIWRTAAMLRKNQNENPSTIDNTKFRFIKILFSSNTKQNWPEIKLETKSDQDFSDHRALKFPWFIIPKIKWQSGIGDRQHQSFHLLGKRNDLKSVVEKWNETYRSRHDQQNHWVRWNLDSQNPSSTLWLEVFSELLLLWSDQELKNILGFQLSQSKDHPLNYFLYKLNKQK